MPEATVNQETAQAIESQTPVVENREPPNPESQDSLNETENSSQAPEPAENPGEMAPPDAKPANEIPDQVKILITPISNSAPCGEDPKYNIEFETVKAELEKTGATDYQLITENCRKILETQSKDIRIFSFLTLSSAIEEGPFAYLHTVWAMKICIQEYWENIHPRRENAKLKAIQWLNQEKVHALLEKMETNFSHYDCLSAICIHLTEISIFFNEKFPDSPPSIAGLIKFFKGLATKNKPNETAKAIPLQQPAESIPDSFTDSASALIALQKGAQFIIQNSPENPIGCKVMRALKWQPIKQAPNAPGNIIKIQGPNQQMLAYYSKMMEQQNWKDIIQKGESAFTRPGLHFWLDLQFYIHSSYKGLGDGYSACASALEDELVALMSRAPELLNFKFQNNIPFAGAATADWINQEIMTKSGGGGGGVADFTKSEEVENAKNEARELTARGNLSQALALLQSVGRGRDACVCAQLKYLMAELSFQSQRPEVAEGVIEGLAMHLDSAALTDWDPIFYGAFCNLKLKIYSSLAEKKDLSPERKQEIRAKAHEAFQELSRLNPGAAIQVNFELK